MKQRFFYIILCFAVFSVSESYCQKIDLIARLNSHQLLLFPKSNISVIKDRDNALSCNGIVWLKDFFFSTGTIEVDLKGRDIFQQSFLGIAFHGVDTVTYDAIYFRPFNFQAADTLRKKHTVQYMSEPLYGWEKLRNEHPLAYENAVNPFPQPTDWFHARIVVGKDSIAVYVNHSEKASLKVKKLNSRIGGLIGLWNYGLNGDFANLAIKKD